jgi:hypothetical protein
LVGEHGGVEVLRAVGLFHTLARFAVADEALDIP